MYKKILNRKFWKSCVQNRERQLKLGVNKMKMDDSISHLSGSCFTVYRTCRTEFDSSVVILTEASLYPHHLWLPAAIPWLSCYANVCLFSICASNIHVQYVLHDYEYWLQLLTTFSNFSEVVFIDYWIHFNLPVYAGVYVTLNL